MSPQGDEPALSFTTWRADPGWRVIDLLSDVHLTSDARRTFDAWRNFLLSTSADAVLILGDLFEVWVGDDSRVTGFDLECLNVLREATRRRAVAFMSGNRDFLVGEEMLRDSGVQALDDPTLAVAWGRRILLTHGDRLCLADADYQRFRHEVRSPRWQQAFLALPLDERRSQARAMRDASRAHQAARAVQAESDADPTEAARWMEAAGTDCLVHGHTHRPGTHVGADARVRHVLGDWDFETGSPRAQALRWTAQGLVPLDLAGR